MAVNVTLFRLSGGRLGSKMGKQSVLLLHTLGRKSGKPYTTPLAYFRDGQDYLVVASNWGKNKNPDWFQNLMRQPRTTIQVKNQTLPVEAHQVEGEEYERLWELVGSQNQQYLQYQEQTPRQIPIVILTPIR
jgi:deazaflavin-dependent oxidoreductase (nitroreductase family)